MAEVSKITLPNGKSYEIKDKTRGCATATSVANIPVADHLVVATISASGSFSLASVPAKGNVVHTIIKNSGSGTVTVTFPTASSYVNMSDDTVDIDAGGYAEVNCVSDGTKIYLRVI